MAELRPLPCSCVLAACRRSRRLDRCGRVLDLGAGTGRSSIMVLTERPQATLVASDLFGPSIHGPATAGESGRRDCWPFEGRREWPEESRLLKLFADDASAIVSRSDAMRPSRSRGHFDRRSGRIACEAAAGDRFLPSYWWPDWAVAWSTASWAPTARTGGATPPRNRGSRSRRGYASRHDHC